MLGNVISGFIGFLLGGLIGMASMAIVVAGSKGESEKDVR